jgi:replication initiation protein RepC
MQTGQVTTPFGRRPMTYAMLKDQMAAVDGIEDGASVDKWKIYRALCEARTRFGVTDRALAVLNALLSFYPKAELSAEDTMIVFPSNAQLSLRAHGMAEQTIRRHLAVLIEAGLLTRKDSANGKRFARRARGQGKEGVIDEAFGFSLAPLLARAEEIEHLAAEVEAERLHLQRLKERLTICRRDVTKLIETALEEAAPGNWFSVQLQYRAIMEAYPRNPSAEIVAETLDEMEFLREYILNQLEIQLKTEKLSGNPGHIERHIQNSKPDSISDLEPLFEKSQGENPDAEPQTLSYLVDGSENPMSEVSGREGEIREAAANPAVTRPTEVKSRQDLAGAHAYKPFPLGMVLSACPEIANYGQNGSISSWRDMMAAAVLVRSMLGVSPSAYEEACAALGPENAATVIACILERSNHINSAGGYLRDLTRRAERQEFSLGPMLMAQIKTNGPSLNKVG